MGKSHTVARKIQEMKKQILFAVLLMILIPSTVNAQIPTQISNLTNQLNQSAPANNAWSWITSAPLQAIWQAVTGGSVAIVQWISSGIQGLLTYILGSVFPTVKLPDFFGTAIFIFILLVFGWFAITRFAELGMKIFAAVLMLGGIFVAVIFILSILHVI